MGKMKNNVIRGNLHSRANLKYDRVSLKYDIRHCHLLLLLHGFMYCHKG
jgi:hypothetical protein